MRGGLVPAALGPLSSGCWGTWQGHRWGCVCTRYPRLTPAGRMGLGGRGSCFGSAVVTQELLDQPWDSRLCAAWKQAACISVIGAVCPEAAPGETSLPEYFFFLFLRYFSC